MTVPIKALDNYTVSLWALEWCIVITISTHLLLGYKYKDYKNDFNMNKQHMFLRLGIYEIMNITTAKILSEITGIWVLLWYYLTKHRLAKINLCCSILKQYRFVWNDALWQSSLATDWLGWMGRMETLSSQHATNIFNSS